MSDQERLDIIDDHNNVIGQMTKPEAYAHRAPHRIVHIMVYDGKRVFLPRRSLEVRYLPGYYCTSAGGHVQSGESSSEAALRELKEEIGLSGPITLIEDFFFEREFKVHVSLYLKKYDGALDSLGLNPHEVLSGDFYSFEDIEKMNHDFFHPQLEPCLMKTRDYLQASENLTWA